MTGEKVFQLKDTTGCVHVFFGGDARDGRFVHANLLRDVMQYQCLHCLFAVFQEGALMFDNATGNLEQGLIAAGQTLYKPARLLQMVFEIIVVGAVIDLFDKAGVVWVDAESRRCLWI